MSSPWTMISMSLVMVGCGGDTVWSIADRKAAKESAGRPPIPKKPQRHRRVDYLIAATAIVIDADLLTTNVRHFPMFTKLKPAY
jgi:predicted nucleic acid-binding protein